MPSLNLRGSMFLTFYSAMWIQLPRILLELGQEFSHLSLSLIQILPKHFLHSTFALIHFTCALINIKSQSEDSFFLYVSLFEHFHLLLFYFSLHRAFFSSALLLFPYLLGTFNPLSRMGRFAYLVDSAKSIESFKAQYKIPSRVSIRYCKQGDWHTNRQEGEVVIPIIVFIEGGMRIPMGRVTKDYLRVHRLTRTQCALNIFRILGSVDTLNEKMGLNLTHHDVNWVYNLHHLKG